MAAQSAPGKWAETGHDAIGIVEEIADQHDVAPAADHRRLRQPTAQRRVHQCRRQSFGSVAGGNRFHDAGAADALAGAGGISANASMTTSARLSLET